MVQQQKLKIFLTKKKKAKIMKWSHAYRDYTSAFNAEILNSFNSERQFKDSEYAVRNKIKH